MGAPDAPQGKRRKDVHGNRTDLNGANPAGDSASDNHSGQGDEETSAAAIKAFQRFAARTDGWLRIAPDGEAKDVFLKWKWTRGRFSNKYVMVRCEHWQIAAGMAMLERKAEEVELNLRVPVEDRFYQ